MLRSLLLSTCALLVPSGVASQSLPSWAEPQRLPPAEQRLPPLYPDGFPPPPPPPEGVPVDGGLGLLALAGGAYAVRRLRGRRS